MPAVTQQVPNFLGGVSRQNDDKKVGGQLTECINGYPDPTFGLLKRPGEEFINVLKKGDGTAFTKAELEGAAWFFIERDTAGSYIGAVKGSDIYVWTADEGIWCTVDNTASSYLTGTTKDDYHFRSVQDTTVITNRNIVTAMQPKGTFVADSVATLVLDTLIENFEYTVTISDIAIKVTAQGTTTYDDMLKFDPADINTNHHLIDAIRDTILAQQTASNTDFDGVWYLEGYTNSLVIKRGTGTNSVVTDYSAVTGTPLAIDISASGGLDNLSLEAFTDSVNAVSDLPAESFHDHNVQVLNTSAEEDDYYLKFQAYDGEKGRGYWQETVARDASPGLDASTMPHILVNTGETTFEFKPIEWKPRAAGNDVTSPLPSFIEYPINSTFYYNNRFGVLSADNIFFGVANDPYNFFVRSGLTQTPSDPIDLNVASIKPVVLSEVLPSPQGLLLFSARQQFQVFTSDGNTLTPSTASIRSLSNYEMATDIAPADVGTMTAFVSRVPGYSKVFTLQLRDIEQRPIVVDISKVVLEWLPETIDDLSVSPQNSLIILTDRDTPYLYVFRYYNDGEKYLFQAWTKWELTGTVQIAKIINDSAIIVSQHEDEYTLGKIVLDEIPTGNVIATSTGINGNSCLDMATRPVSPGEVVALDDTTLVAGSDYEDGTDIETTTDGLGVGLTVDITQTDGALTSVVINSPGVGYKVGDTITISGGTDGTIDVSEISDSVVYDEANDVTKIYVPFTPFVSKTGVMLLTTPIADVGTEAAIDADAGYWSTAFERTEPVTGYRYFEVKGNFLNYTDGIVVGYSYDLDVTLPRFYFKLNETSSDFSAALTIARVKFSVNRSGAVKFKLKAAGSNEWVDVQHVAEANYYSGDSNPVQPEHQFTVPIHQRNTNFELKVTSDLPYPVSLVSMMWEGNYSQRFYRRT